MMRMILALALAAFLPGVAMAETRCGWLANPTPGNWWLTDAEGTWTLMVQGGRPAPGMDVMPDMTTRGWVKTNGNYGYGCACFEMSVDRASRRVIEVRSARALPLGRCEADRRLRSP